MEKMLPKVPGVYLFKNSLGQVIYIGKAKNIDKRVRSYFRKQKTDWKVNVLLTESSDVDYILTKNEIEALLLEAQLVKDYKPKFNVLLKEGQPFLYLLFTRPTVGLPKIELVRNKKKKGMYFGPFLHKQQARRVHRYLVETFRLSLCNKKLENGCLDYHLGLCAGNCKQDFDHEAYSFRLQLAYDALRKNRKKLIKTIKEKINQHNDQLAFEKAKYLHEYLENLDVILHTLETKFSEDKYWYEIERKVTPDRLCSLQGDDVAIALQKLLGLERSVKTIDCFDISHFQSNALVGSCVRFSNGIPDKDKFRRFKIRTLTRQNDYAALQEIVSRRYYKCYLGNADASKDLPTLILIDGGKGQLNAVQSIIPDIPCVSLAKREETLYSSRFPRGIKLDVNNPVGKLLIMLRDYAHHFAINYHRLCRSKNL